MKKTLTVKIEVDGCWNSEAELICITDILDSIIARIRQNKTEDRDEYRMASGEHYQYQYTITEE